MPNRKKQLTKSWYKPKFSVSALPKIDTLNQRTLELMIELKKQEVRLAELNLQLQSSNSTQKDEVYNEASTVTPPKKFLIKLKPRHTRTGPSTSDTTNNDNFSSSTVISPVSTSVDINGIDVNRTDVTSADVSGRSDRLRNFGKENCRELTSVNVKRLLATLDGHPESFLLSRDLLLLIWFNPKYPENHNLRYSKSLDYSLTERSLLVYYENGWSQVYWLTLIREYLQGMFIRLRIILDSEDVERVHKSVFSDLEEFYHNFWYTIIEANGTSTHP